MEQKKKALGRGLEQLFSSEVLDFDQFESNIMEETDVTDIKELPVEEIRPNPYQPRKSFDEEALKEKLKSDEIIIDVELNNGDFKGQAWGCDLTYKYVQINASYRS